MERHANVTLVVTLDCKNISMDVHLLLLQSIKEK